MEKAPETVLVYSDISIRRSMGRANALRLHLRQHPMNSMKTDSPDPDLVRFRDLVLYDHSCIVPYSASSAVTR